MEGSGKRHLKTFVYWFWGILFILAGIGALLVTIIGGLAFFLAGLLLLPPFSKFVENRFNFSLKGLPKGFGVVILVIIGFTLIPTETPTTAPSAPTKAPQETESEQKEELEKPSEPAKFEISRMSVTPSEINPGETVHISVSIKNIGGKEGSKEVKLAVNGNIIKTKSVTLDPGEQKDILFNVVGEEIGVYNLNVLGTVDTFEVKRPFVDISFSKFNSLFGAQGTLTSVQKEKKFNSEFKDKYVKWTCKLVDVREGIFGGYYIMDLKCDPRTFHSDMSVDLREDQKDKAMALTKGEEVTFIARLTGYGELLGHSADNGIIVD